jgi:hypothetical protein
LAPSDDFPLFQQFWSGSTQPALWDSWPGPESTNVLLVCASQQQSYGIPHIIHFATIGEQEQWRVHLLGLTCL